MNIVYLHGNNVAKESTALYSRMERSLKSAGVDFAKSVRLAKVLAPILSDETSNTRHIATINSSAPTQEKVIAVLMLGFPKNRSILPTLQNVLLHDTEPLRMAATIALTQMHHAHNNDVIEDILQTAYKNETSPDVRRGIDKALKTIGV